MNRWTFVTVAAALWTVGAVVNAVWNPSWVGLIGLPLAFVVAYWIVGGCARRGDPLARWLLRRRRWVHVGHE